jgi:hypothetical protein
MLLAEFLAASPADMDGQHVEQTIISVGRALPERVGFIQSKQGDWSGQLPVRDKYPDGSRDIYDPNLCGGNFGQFELYNHQYGLYLAANIPQTPNIGAAYDAATLTSGRIGKLKIMNLLDLYYADSEDKRWALERMQVVARSVLEWYGVDVVYPYAEPRITTLLRVFGSGNEQYAIEI